MNKPTNTPKVATSITVNWQRQDGTDGEAELYGSLYVKLQATLSPGEWDELCADMQELAQMAHDDADGGEVSDTAYDEGYADGYEDGREDRRQADDMPEGKSVTLVSDDEDDEDDEDATDDGDEDVIEF
jgi:hypothetical protein